MAIFPEQKYGPVSSKMLLSDGVAIWTAARSGSLNGALRLRIMKATWATETNVAFQVSRFPMTSGFSRGPRLLNKYQKVPARDARSLLAHAFNASTTTLTRYMSSTMAPIDEAIAAARSQTSPNLVEISRLYGINRSTLSRRVRGIQYSKAVQYENQRLLTQPQERTLVGYID
jgi:hypothetical protein